MLHRQCPARTVRPTNVAVAWYVFGYLGVGLYAQLGSYGATKIQMLKDFGANQKITVTRCATGKADSVNGWSVSRRMLKAGICWVMLT